MSDLSTSPSFGFRSAFALAATPAVVIFLSSNFVNVGNLAFNMIFSRLLGPELFGTLALLLTIKLALLGIMGAVQMAVSQMVASCTGDERPGVEQALSRINRFLFLGLFILGITLTTGLALGEAVGARPLPVETVHLAMLLAAVPFGASLSVLRGIAFGDLRTGRIVLSANVEMGVRLVGALLAWFLGFGLEGIVLAIGLSIVAGWLVVADLLPGAPMTDRFERHVTRVALLSVPFALLQVTQVVALDGEVFLASALLSEADAGLTAALSLFQRIQFFACFALASVLLPRVISAAQAGEPVVSAATPAFVLFAAVSVLVVMSALIAPDMLVTLLVGQAYLPASGSVLSAVLASAAFTFNYLIATFLIALKDKLGIIVIVLGVAAQFGAMAQSDPTTFHELIAMKVLYQIAIAALLCFCLIRRLHQKTSSSTA